MRWDLFARVVDNLGDVGFAWRLAADLAGRGDTVRLWIDDATALAWMAPGGAAGVSIGPWHDAVTRGLTSTPADAVVETFGCGLPAGYVAGMAAQHPRPVWVNVEYLSAESYVERSHGLPSPHAMADGSSMTQWYFYPGFTPATGGLVREPHLIAQRERFDGSAWLEGVLAADARPRPGERTVSLFCYDNPALPDLLAELATEPTLLLAATGATSARLAHHLGAGLSRGALRAVALPPLSQPAFDRLLWACDLNLVRGEDSFVRAQWARKPFLWQIYPQADAAHARKLDAFIDRFCAAAPATLQSAVRSAFQAWNGLAPWSGLPAADTWAAHCRSWCDRLEGAVDLARALRVFVEARLLK